ncbi:OLC1v1002415C1 [Oldenlandia corymbosa var. corymbosa]|uniref:OLC1v1002415C1 n=1 Tax=Oldenlandia corymbosa var. corymbosa TaxID=529605 RepID=A0AAV1DAF3_OLDCO|nr:OLC1v1002415C1 [Oldenlandia corymbosa var. corymbosa]
MTTDELLRGTSAAGDSQIIHITMMRSLPNMITRSLKLTVMMLPCRKMEFRPRRSDHSWGKADASEEFVQDVINLDTHVLVTVSGEIADPRSSLRDLKTQYVPPKSAEASYYVADVMSARGYKRRGLEVNMRIAGWDEPNGFSLYYVDGSGNLFAGKICAVGAGSPCTGGLSVRSYHYELSFDQAKELAREMILTSTSEVAEDIECGDTGETGGFVSVYHVGVDGWKTIVRDEYVEEEANKKRDEKWEGYLST